MVFEGPRKRIEKLYQESQVRRITDSDRIVIFSDMHMGNKGRGDDFKDNAWIFDSVMRSRYLPHNFDLILNGDIEELHKYRLRSVMRQWSGLYSLFRELKDREGLMKIYGNHDERVWQLGVENPLSEATNHGLRLDYKNNPLFLFHGHQASLRAESMEKWVHIAIKYGASPLGVKNRAFPHESSLKFNIEERVYEFSRRNKVLSIIGHTHRPLFESMSRADTLKFKIETMMRDYPNSSREARRKIEKDVRKYKDELDRIMETQPKLAMRASLYNKGVVVPCLFNSGTCIGNKGITCIEIEDGRISLVYWFDSDRTTKYFDYNGYVPENLGGSSIYRVVLKEEDLSYVFSRINLLS